MTTERKLKWNEYNRKRFSEIPLVRKKHACRNQTKRLMKSRNFDYTNKLCDVIGCQEHGVIHHWDYNECLDISFLCKEHHLAVHRGEDVNCLRHF